MKRIKASCYLGTITSRYPDEKELKNMMTYLEESDEGLLDTDENPQDLLNIGETPLDESVDLEELYKYTTLACVLLNLEETIIKS